MNKQNLKNINFLFHTPNRTATGYTNNTEKYVNI